jgi:hypothetical protein
VKFTQNNIAPGASATFYNVSKRTSRRPAGHLRLVAVVEANQPSSPS